MKLTYKILLIGLLIGFLLGILIFYYSNLRNNRELELTVYPPQAIANIGGKIYHLKKGSRIIKIPPGTYTLTVTYPGYYPQTQSISLTDNKKESLYIALIPINWPQKILIANQNIQEFQLIDNGNKIVYLVENKNKKGKTKYRLLLFNRLDKKSLIITENYSKPSFIDISPRKILYRVNSHYYIKFLSSFLPISSIELQNYLKKITGQKFIIRKVFFSPVQEDSLIFQTANAIYQFNFLEDELMKIVSKKISFCILKNKKIFFFTPEGLLFSYNLINKKITQESLSVFQIKENQAPKISIINNNSALLILDSNQKLYYLEKNKLPQLLIQGVTNFWVSPEQNTILIQKNNNTLSLFNLQNFKEQNINLPAERIISWLSNNLYFLYLSQDTLLIYSLPQNKSFTLAKNIINNQVQVDNSLKQIFYLNKEGIQITNW